jgi:hypothetical protein
MDTELLKELADLRLQVEKLTPYYEKHIATVKEQELAKYGLTAEDIWVSRLTADTDEGIQEQAKALATELALVERNKPVDPSNMGNGAVYHGKGSVREHLYDVGRNAVKQAHGRLNPAKNRI